MTKEKELIELIRELKQQLDECRETDLDDYVGKLSKRASRVIMQLKNNVDVDSGEKEFCGCEKPKHNYPEMVWCDNCGKEIGKSCMPDNVNTKEEYKQYLKDIGYYKWNKPTNTPERVKEHWCPEETAQEVLIQYFRAKRYEVCVGWFEGGKWWCNDEEIWFPIVSWRRLKEKHKPEIQWEFKEWAEKSVNEAFIIGIDDFGIEYEATGIMGCGEIVEVNNISVKTN